MSQTVSAHPVETLDGQLLHIRYRHPNSTWCVGEAVGANGGRVSVVGRLGDIALNRAVIFYGHWETHPQYGRRFSVQAARIPEPLTAQGLARYLASAGCPHLGPKTADKLVQALGSDVLTVIRHQPERVAELKGISRQKARQWQTFFQQQQGADAIMVWLLQWDIDPSIARRLYAEYGAEALAKVQANPYVLTQEVWGVGFHTADRMALSMGWKPLSPERLDAVWRFGLETALTQGDCYQTGSQLIDRAVELLSDQDPDHVRQALVGQDRRGATLPDVVVDQDRWQLRWVQRMEQQLARRVKTHPQRTATGDPIDWTWLEAKTAVHYEAAQQAALTGVLQQMFSVVTGGPGVGKTTILNGLLTWLVEHERIKPNRIALAAPTARAAQRMAAVTGHNALTLHRLLEWSPTERGFVKGPADPLDVDWLIVDEASMLDLPLATALWQATASKTRMVWIGDEHQLPAVGPGSVLKDLMDSGIPAIFRLTFNFRSQSGITVAAHSLLAHQVPRPNADVVIHRYDKGADKQRVQDDLVTHMLQLQRDGTPWEAIQVLTPIRRGLLGTDALNARLRDVINPAPSHHPSWTAVSGQTFRVGDRVMQVKNAYAKNVFNGDMGLVTDIRPDPAQDDGDNRLWVQFLDQTVAFTADEARHLQPAYATTVHKAQGSEFPVVLVPFFYDSYMMLYRNLVYTAMTRARDRLVLLTEASALWLALKRGDSAARQTGVLRLLLNS